MPTKHQRKYPVNPRVISTPAVSTKLKALNTSNKPFPRLATEAGKFTVKTSH
jgi:hypothetical protein